MKKKLLFLLLFILMLSGCSKIKSYDESLDILENKEFTYEKIENEDYFNVKNVNRIVVEDGLYIATIYYCKSKEDAQALFKIIYNIYLSYIYSSDIYGFNNTYKLIYGLISEPEIHSESVSGVDLNVLESINYNHIMNIYLFNFERFNLFPNFYLPDTYEEFEKNQDYYTPQCYLKGNNIYFGSQKILNLVS